MSTVYNYYDHYWVLHYTRTCPCKMKQSCQVLYIQVLVSRFSFSFVFSDNIANGITLMLAPGLGLISADCPENKTIWHDVNVLVKRLAPSINHLDERLRIYHQYAGSIAEGTKTGLLDEFDIQLCIQALEGKLTVYHQDSWTRMINMRLTDDTNMTAEWEEFLSEDNTVRPDKLFGHMLRLLCLVSSRKELYDGLHFYFKNFNVQRRELYLIWAPTGMVIKFDIAFMVKLPKYGCHQTVMMTIPCYMDTVYKMDAMQCFWLVLGDLPLLQESSLS